MCTGGVCWEEGGTVRGGDYVLYLGRKNNNHQLGTGLFVQNRIVKAVKRVDFDGDKMSYIVLRGCWCNTIVLHVYQVRRKVKIQKIVLRAITTYFVIFLNTI